MRISQGLGGPAALEASDPAPGGQERLLDCLLGDGPIAGHEDGRAVHDILVPFHQVAEGVAVSILAACDGVVVDHGPGLIVAPSLVSD